MPSGYFLKLSFIVLVPISWLLDITNPLFGRAWKKYQIELILVLREWENLTVNHSLKQWRENITMKKQRIELQKFAHCGRNILKIQIGILSKLLWLMGNIRCVFLIGIYLCYILSNVAYFDAFYVSNARNKLGKHVRIYFLWAYSLHSLQLGTISLLYTSI